MAAGCAVASTRRDRTLRRCVRSAPPPATATTGHSAAADRAEQGCREEEPAKEEVALPASSPSAATRHSTASRSLISTNRESTPRRHAYTGDPRPRGRRCSGTCCPATSASRSPPATPSPSRSSPTTSYPTSSPSSTPARSKKAMAGLSPSRRSGGGGTTTRCWWRRTSTTCRSCGGRARRGWRRAWSPGTRCGRWRWRS
ncbi:hypothetical protein PVAP13_8KG065484 [Panicum virgatum]|uniref:Uncharacterized protein n=1 Tax=Panicum virgatum TaxID=38727 RepID=A0A8T0PEF9_PANVG|nr:hypothetical protein PVAP13_8KG065484 [Panicum virgatum]